MTTSILPTAAQQAIARIDSILTASTTRNTATITSLEKTLTGTQGVTQDEIIAAGGDRYASLLNYIAALKSAANIATPGTYPS